MFHERFERTWMFVKTKFLKLSSPRTEHGKMDLWLGLGIGGSDYWKSDYESIDSWNENILES